MEFKERIDDLMKKNKIDSYVSLLQRIYRHLSSEDPYGDAEKNKSNFTQMLNGKRPLNKDYYIPLERIFNVTIDYIINGGAEPIHKYENKGLRFACSTNNYNEFVKLGAESCEVYDSVIFNTDEYDKSIIDYIIEFKAIEGLRYLVNEQGFKCQPIRNILDTDKMHFYCNEEKTKGIVDLLVKSNEVELFNIIFNPYDILVYYDEERSIYNNKEFIYAILLCNPIFESLLTKKEFMINEINRRPILKEDTKSIFINPILNNILSYCLDNSEQYIEQINKILDYGISENQSIIDYVKGIEFNYRNNSFDVDKDGMITVNNYDKVGCLINPGEVIDPVLPREIKEKISIINEMINSINYTDIIDYFGNNYKKTRYNKEGHILKLASKNEDEYKIYEFFNELNAPVPKYYGQKDGVDEFEKYRGTCGRGRLDINKVCEVVKFIRRLQDSNIPDHDKYVYVHGDMDAGNFYFTGEELTDVVNWDKCHKGNLYEDMIMLILNYSGISDLYRKSDVVINNIKKMFEAYCASKNYITACIGFLKLTLSSAIKDLEKTDLSEDDNATREYEIYMWCLSFVNAHYKELENIKIGGKNED